MVEDAGDNLELIRRYLSALESGRAGEDIAAFFTNDAIQVEFPNRLNPNGAKSDLNEIIERSIQGQKILSSQKFLIHNELAQENRIAIEASWTGTLSIPVGELKAGAEMKARFAMFFELQKGRICKQHNYDCFEPW